MWASARTMERNRKMTKIVQATEVEVEHGIGDQEGAFVVFRVICDDVVVLTQIKPESARSIASSLMKSAARAEYESDFFSEMKAADWSKQMMGAVLTMVRTGEIRRCTGLG